MSTKICNTCEKTKPTDEFSMKDKKQPGRGFNSQCKRCLADKASARQRAARPDMKLRNKAVDELTRPTKFCSKCDQTKATAEFSPKNSKLPEKGFSAWCKRCHADNAAEKKRAANPDMKPRNLRAKNVTGTLQPCQRCGIEKDLCMFPENTTKNGQVQKTCQACQNDTHAKRAAEIQSGERKVGDGMAFHNPVVDGKKQCRECKVWKEHNPDNFMTRRATGGYFNECKDCRRGNALKYAHATWNEVIRNRRLNDDAYKALTRHRSSVYMTVISRHSTHGPKYLDEFGCTGQELRKWIEFQFDADMSWDNYGLNKAWSLDHIVALDNFDLLDPVERKLAFSWTNIQPCRDNFQKHSSLRLYEVMNMVVSAHRFLVHMKSDMQRYSAVRDMLAWLRTNVSTTAQ
jgi:hypothetical protein